MAKELSGDDIAYLHENKNYVEDFINILAIYVWGEMEHKPTEQEAHAAIIKLCETNPTVNRLLACAQLIDKEREKRKAELGGLPNMDKGLMN